jgi:hypothetical protein
MRLLKILGKSCFTVQPSCARQGVRHGNAQHLCRVVCWVIAVHLSLPCGLFHRCRKSYLYRVLVSIFAVAKISAMRFYICVWQKNLYRAGTQRKTARRAPVFSVVVDLSSGLLCPCHSPHSTNFKNAYKFRSVGTSYKQLTVASRHAHIFSKNAWP